MTDSERLLRRSGAVMVPSRRHLVYLLRGQRFTLHRGGNPNHMEIVMVRRKLRRLGLPAS
jgi:hypothetical protein